MSGAEATQSGSMGDSSREQVSAARQGRSHAPRVQQARTRKHLSPPLKMNTPPGDFTFRESTVGETPQERAGRRRRPAPLDAFRVCVTYQFGEHVVRRTLRRRVAPHDITRLGGGPLTPRA